MENHCLYTEIDKRGKERHRLEVCFAPTDFNKLSGLHYYPKLEGGLRAEHAAFWIEFCKALFPNDLPFTAKLMKHNGNTHIRWSMTRFSDSRKHNLLYTTAFRYPDEFPMVVRLLFNAKLRKEDGSRDWPALFTLFHQMHTDMVSGMGAYGFLFEERYVENHSLISYHGGSSRDPITLAQFHENLGKRIEGVHKHFCYPPDLSPAHVVE